MKIHPWALALLLSSACATNGARTSDFVLRGEIPADPEGLGLALYQTLGTPFTEGNQVEWIDNGALFDLIAKDVRTAKSSINIVLFIWRSGEPGDSLAREIAQRTKEGVVCRVLLDPFGSNDLEIVKPQLERAGCDVRIFRPLPADETLARNHRKLVIVDGRVGYTGGFGVHTVWLGDARNENEWRDVAVRAEGPVVAQMQQAFAENWQEMGGVLLPASDFAALHAPGKAGGARAAYVSSTPNPELSRAERSILLMCKAARSRLWIGQSYFTPTSSLLELLVQQAHSGVDTRVLAPGDKNDQPAITLTQRLSYPDLATAGVRLWEWPISMMHSKVILADDHLVMVGSINFDILSYRLMEEGALIVDDKAFARQAERAFLSDFQKSVEVGQRWYGSRYGKE
ncbi:phospholipase D-like domain-containing protein [Archangium primigenium]|uniref:phospholipase D-like domain-containing protein n=1 Tax=[Archangium] primigenium TaxID=2792470 RepID=UPI001959AEB9|nr:phospholipase D-like domain-containing protein [Archangium primigenium]MBM7114369.1 Cardiolipin synthetase [Archangium primigenium]